MPYDPELGIDEKHAAILRVLEGLRYSYEWVPFSKIKEKLPYSESLIKTKLRDLAKGKAVKVSWIEQYRDHGVKITEKGIDIIAVWDYKRNEVIKKLGTLIGTGKESTIYSAIDYDNQWVVIKFNRYYRAEFRKIKRSLAYIAIRWRIKELRIREHKIDIPKAKAQIEYYVLNKLYKDFPVPRPIAINRHSVVMEMIYDDPGIPAKQLTNFVVSDPRSFYKKLVETYNGIVEKMGIIHGDLSAENILVKKDGSFWIIDWCQAVPKEFKGAEELYKRDIENIRKFFIRKYKLDLPS